MYHSFLIHSSADGHLGSWLFERTDKPDKPLERLIKKKRQSTNHQHRGFLKGETTHFADKKDTMNHSSLTNWRVCAPQ